MCADGSMSNYNKKRRKISLFNLIFSIPFIARYVRVLTTRSERVYGFRSANYNNMYTVETMRLASNCNKKKKKTSYNNHNNNNKTDIKTG